MRSISAFDPDKTGNQDLRLDSQGNLVLVTEIEEVRQRIVERLRWQLGEWFLRMNDGVPYRTRVFTGVVSTGLAAAVITEAILSERGVTSVLDVQASINFTTRLMSYRARVVTSFGDFNVDEVVSG